MTRILLLGGTTEASLLARRLAEDRMDAVFSYAGRTGAPIAQPLPTRVGGFGGSDGMIRYLMAEGITHVIDATHPFAAQISRNACVACTAAGVALAAFERPAWRAGPGDKWLHVPDIDAALHALPYLPARVFLAIGKQSLAAFAARPQHQYLLRLVDPPQAGLPLPHCSIVIARGPFDVATDTALLRDHAISHVVAKNAGGSGAEAKLIAARNLRLPVILIDRPALPERTVLQGVSEVMRWLGHDG